MSASMSGSSTSGTPTPSRTPLKNQQPSLWNRIVAFIEPVVFVGALVLLATVSYVACRVLGSRPVVNETINKCGYLMKKIVDCGCNINASCTAIIKCMDKCKESCKQGKK